MVKSFIDVRMKPIFLIKITEVEVFHIIKLGVMI